MVTNNKIRIDKLLVDLGLFESREKATTCIMSNGVKIAGQLINKPGHQINQELFQRNFAEDPNYLEVHDKMSEFVSRGAFKLKAAHEAWRLDFTNKLIMDIGASTGGFTDYALKQGAKESIAIDVGQGQLHYKLRQDSRVLNFEETNFRLVEPSFFEPLLKESLIGLVVIDVSFISLITILAKLKELSKQVNLFEPDMKIIALIKPQFEAGKKIMDKCGGVIKDPEICKSVLEKTISEIQALDFKVEGQIESPIHGAKGNIEYLALLKIG